MYFPNKNDFQPSGETLKKWLATRKPNFFVEGFTIPGFFSDTGNSSDTNWFSIAILGEIVGLVTTIYGGMIAGGQFVALAILGVLMFIFCDFFFAAKLHRNKALHCELQTRKLLISPKLKNHNNSAEIVAIDQELNKGKFGDFLLQSGIILIALIKVMAIVLLGVFNSVVLYVPFIIIFLIVAYVHINHTGYWFAYISTQSAINQEHKLFATGEYKAKETYQLVETSQKLRLPIKHNPHEIIEDTEKGGNNYIIKVRGVLADEDIVQLIAGQEGNNRTDLFKACRNLQLSNIEGMASLRKKSWWKFWD